MMKTIHTLITDHIDIWTAAETEKKSGRGRSSGNTGSIYGIKKLRELILELAVRGKLVPQDANDEPASELLKRIHAEKAKLVVEGKIKSKSPLTPLLQRGGSKSTAANSNSTSPPLVKGGAGGIYEEEQPFELPRGWEWVRLNELLSKIGAGSTPLGGKQVYVNDGVPFLRSQNVWNEGLRLDDVAYIKPETHQKMSGTHVRDGDLLFNITGASIGRCAIVPDSFDTGNVSQHVVIVRSISKEVLQFLHLVLISNHVQQTVMDVQVGVSREGLSIGKLGQFIIPIPPLTEQHRIVAKVDELMALCDQLETQHSNATEAHEKLVNHLLGTLTQSTVRGEPVEPHPSTSSGRTEFEDNWQRIAAHFDTLFTTEASIDALKQTLLQLAVMGKLVPQDPNDEPASELLKRIQTEKAKLAAEGKIKKSPLTPLLQRGGSKATAMAAMSSNAAFESDNAPPPSPTSPPFVKGGPGGISENEKPFALPRGWEWVRFGDYSTDIATGPFGSMIHQSDYVHGGVPLINPSHMIDDKIIADDSVSVSKTMAKTLDSYAIYQGDIVMARRGEVGRIAVVTKSEDGWLCGTGSFVLRFCEEVSRDYLRVFFRSNYARTYLAGEAVGTTMVNLNHGMLKKMPMELPPLAEQHRIVTKVDELMAICDQLKSRITEAKQLQKELADVLVEQAVSQ